MRFKILSLLAALVLVAACGTAPEENADSNGGTTSTSTAPATTDSTETATRSLDETVPGSVRDFLVNVDARAYFGFNRSDLTDAAQATLAKQAAWLMQFPQVTIQIEGHCDERGTREYNRGLGQRRAESARDYLVSLGVAAERISTISYGKDRPEAGGSDEEAWAQNRRSFTRIVSGANS